METLPELALHKIYKIIYDDVVHEMEITVRAGPGMWMDPSQRLIDLCQDVGTVQCGHTDFHQFIQDHNLAAYKNFFCENCKVYKFPCLNCWHFTYEKSIPCQMLPFCG